MEEIRKLKLWLIFVSQGYGKFESGRVSDRIASKGVGWGFLRKCLPLWLQLPYSKACYWMFWALVLLVTLSGDLNCSRQCLREEVWTKNQWSQWNNSQLFPTSQWVAAFSCLTWIGTSWSVIASWNIMSCLLGMFTGKVGKKEDKEGTSQKMSKMQSMCAGWVCVKVHGYSFLG